MIVIGVIGRGCCNKYEEKLAYDIGREIARHNAALVCGGLGGYMLAASKGAFEAGGQTIGIIPGNNRKDANPFIKIPIVTDMGYARNVIVVRSSQAIIAFPGEYGTLSEIAIARKLAIPVIGLNTWEIEGIIRASDAIQAVSLALEAIKGSGV